jgi:hypothetical protein
MVAAAMMASAVPMPVSNSNTDASRTDAQAHTGLGHRNRRRTDASQADQGGDHANSCKTKHLCFPFTHPLSDATPATAQALI